MRPLPLYLRHFEILILSYRAWSGPRALPVRAARRARGRRGYVHGLSLAYHDSTAARAAVRRATFQIMYEASVYAARRISAAIARALSHTSLRLKSRISARRFAAISLRDI